MSHKPLISVITVSFNAEKYIKGAIESVINQTFTDFEYIIIDGNSTDGTIEIIETYKSKIDVFISERDKGIYDAMNKGIMNAKGEYIYFLNSDDYFNDEFVLADFSTFCKNEPKDIIIGKIDVKYSSPDYFVEETIPFSEYNLRRGIQPPHSGSFFRKRCLQYLGLFDTGYRSAADFDLFCKASQNKCDYVFFDRKIAVFRDGGLSATSNTGRFEGAEIIKKHYGIYWYVRYLIVEISILPIKKLFQITGLFPKMLKIYKQRFIL